MVDLKQGFDSDCIQRCDWCHGPIEPENEKVLYGTGSLLVAYHVRCERDRISLEKIVDEKPKELKKDLQETWPKEGTPLKHTKVFIRKNK